MSARPPDRPPTAGSPTAESPTTGSPTAESPTTAGSLTAELPTAGSLTAEPFVPKPPEPPELYLHFVRFLQRGPSAWSNVGAYLEHRGVKSIPKNIFEMDQMMIALTVFEATLVNNVGLPKMTLVNSIVKFGGVDISTPCKSVFDESQDSKNKRNRALTISLKELEDSRKILRSSLEKERSEELLKECVPVSDQEIKEWVACKIRNAEYTVRRQVEPLIKTNIIEVVKLEDNEKVAWKATPLLFDIIKCMRTGKWPLK